DARCDEFQGPVATWTRSLSLHDALPISRGRQALRRARAPPPEGRMTATWLVTGGAGFIGANFVFDAVARGVRVVNLDALTYAGNLDTLSPLRGNALHVFVHGDICDRGLV